MQSRTEIEPDSDGFPSAAVRKRPDVIACIATADEMGVAEGMARGEQALAKGLSSDTPQGQSPVSPLAEIV